jgi:hypothetical protein
MVIGLRSCDAQWNIDCLSHVIARNHYGKRGEPDDGVGD